MNSFNNDGSFFERFKTMREKSSSKETFISKSGSNDNHSSKMASSVSSIHKKSSNELLAKDSKFLMQFKKLRKTKSDLKSVQKPETNECNSSDASCSSSFSLHVKRQANSNNISSSMIISSEIEVKVESAGDEDERSAVSIATSASAGQSECKRKRRSRWDVDDAGNVQKSPVAVKLEPGTALLNGASDLGVVSGSDIVPNDQSTIGRSVEDTRKQILEQAQLKIMQQQIEMKRVMMKVREQAILMGKAKPVFEYDSDEEADDGTWEHKLRKMEMDKTKAEAEKVTEDATGKHHIGQFLPSEELVKFMAKHQSAKNGEKLEQSDYQESKLTPENKGFKLLQKMGWTEGKGLGITEQGITAPINKGRIGMDNEGLGASSSNEITGDDNEYDLYRKRMMLAYRFRPNPLNNPRRSYY